MIGIFLAACAGPSGLVSKDVTGPSGDDALVVIGVTPRNAAISIREVELQGEGFKYVGFSYPIVQGNVPDAGFLVAKARGGAYFAVTQVALNGLGVPYGRSFFDTCQHDTMAFFVPKGQVVYVGNVDFVGSAYELQPRYSFDYEKAKAYISASFARLTGTVEPVQYEVRRNYSSCVSPAVPFVIQLPEPRQLSAD